MDPRTVILGVAVPALVAGAALLVRRRWLGGPALALAYLAGTIIIFWGGLATELAPRLAAVGLLAAAITAITNPKYRLALLALPAVLGPSIVLWAVPKETLSTGAKVGVGALEAAISYAGMVTFDLWSIRREHFAQVSIAWLVASAGAVAVAIAGYVGGGQAAGGLAAGLGALFVLSFWKPVDGRIHNALPVAFALLPGVWMLGYHFSELPAIAGILLGVAPLGLWVGEITKKRWLGPLALTVILAVGVGIAIASAPPSGE